MTARSFHNSSIIRAVNIVAIACASCSAAQIAYIERPSGHPSTRHQIETSARFYGLEVSATISQGRKDNTAAVKNIRDTRTVGVVITADALANLSQKEIFAALQTQGRRLPLLIAGITEETDPGLLRQWSGEAIAGCKNGVFVQQRDAYIVASPNRVAPELNGVKLPLSQKALPYLVFSSGRKAGRLIAATLANIELPTFADALVGQQEVFFATATPFSDLPLTADPYHQPGVFATLAAPMMFLRYAAGERAWHSPAHSANLTIDDAWLSEPYGYVNYEGLLQEMEQHNFHTTLAFVPWNFDRSQSAMVSMFRAHPERFSICVHGNNHDHREFGSYDEKPLSGQISDIKQALARMAKFSELTGLPYDPVMVFPHAIAPEQTLDVLKHYNFAATANFINVPLGARIPADPEFALRPATMAFSNFPSLRRYSAEAPMPESQLAIDAFLGNPMLFYVHQNFFAHGIAAFDSTADIVNRLQPDTKWRSLGYIAQHLYLEKLRDDGNYEIRAYSGTIRLRNSHERDTTFFVEKEEDFTLPLTVLVDGQDYTYQRLGSRLRLQLRVPAGMTREIAIQYKNDFNLAKIDISKRSLRIAMIRRLSDFRDNVVSKTSLGRQFIQSYSESASAWNQAMIGFFGLLTIALGYWYIRRRRKRLSEPQKHSIPRTSCRTIS